MWHFLVFFGGVIDCQPKVAARDGRQLEPLGWADLNSGLYLNFLLWRHVNSRNVVLTIVFHSGMFCKWFSGRVSMLTTCSLCGLNVGLSIKQWNVTELLSSIIGFGTPSHCSAMGRNWIKFLKKLGTTGWLILHKAGCQFALRPLIAWHWLPTGKSSAKSQRQGIPFFSRLFIFLNLSNQWPTATLQGKLGLETLLVNKWNSV